MKLKYSFSFLLLFLAAQCALAQTTLSGTVKDLNSNEQLVGATIYISSLKQGVPTDKDGQFHFENLRSSTYLLEISSVGYKTNVFRLNLIKDTSLDLFLTPSVAELNEVVITAVTRNTELKRSPVIITTLDKSALNQQSATNLIDALKNVPGVSQLSTGVSIAKPMIRGLGYNRVISLYNSIRQEGQQWGDEHGIEIDQYDIDRIEIVKGPGSLMYGSDGIAGVLNFLSPKAPHADDIKTSMLSNYQSNNNLVGFSLSNAGNKKGLQWLGRLSNNRAGNYQNRYDGKVYNSGFKELHGSLFLGINKNWGHSHFNASSYNNTLNLVEGERDSLGHFLVPLADGSERSATQNDLNSFGIGYPHQVVKHLRVSNNNLFLLKKGSLHADFAFQNNKRKEYADVAEPTTAELFFDLNTFNYNLRYNLDESKGWETSFGLGGMQQSNRNRGEEFLIPEYTSFDIGAFLYTQKAIVNNINFAGGLRFDNRFFQSHELILDNLGEPTNTIKEGSENKFSAFNQSYNGLSGSIGLSYQASPQSTIKVNLSRGFRAPNIAELASNGKHEGSFRYEIGEVNLKSEISQQIDVAYFFHSEHISLELTPFANFISNYIYTKKLKTAIGQDSIPDPSDPAPAFVFTQGNARLYGGELYFDIHPHPLDWLHVANSFSFVRATQVRVADSLKNLPFIPTPKYRGELKGEWNNVNKCIGHLYIKFSVDHYFKQDHIFIAYQTETKTPSYTLLGAGVGGTLKAFSKKDFCSLFISADNLANVAYQSHLSRLKYAAENLNTGRIGVYNMGRNVSVKLIFNY